MGFQPLYAFAGLMVGLLVGLSGVGGGSLMTPLLVLVFGVHPSVAVGTDLLYAAMTKTVGSLVHGIKQSIDWRVVGRLAIGSVPAAVLSLVAIGKLDKGSEVATIITIALGVILVLTGIVLFFNRVIAAWARRRAPDGPRKDPLLATILLGAIVGVAVSITSVGAGAIGATALLVLYPHFAPKRIVGTDIAHAVPLTLIGGIGHWWLGSVDFTLLGSLLAGSIPGIIIGSLLASRMAERGLRTLLAAVLVLVGTLLLV